MKHREPVQVDQKRNSMFRLGGAANKTGCKVHVLLSEVCVNKTCNDLNKDTRGEYNYSIRCGFSAVRYLERIVFVEASGVET